LWHGGGELVRVGWWGVGRLKRRRENTGKEGGSRPRKRRGASVAKEGEEEKKGETTGRRKKIGHMVKKREDKR
jgi:hypothetical protein